MRGVRKEISHYSDIRDEGLVNAHHHSFLFLADGKLEGREINTSYLLYGRPFRVEHVH